MELYRISNLPPAGKTFVGIFTALALCICLWAVHIFYIEKIAESDEHAMFAWDYDESPGNAEAVAEHLLAEDPEAVHAPVWDSNQAGQEETLGVDELADELSDHAAATDEYDGDYDEYAGDDEGEHDYHENVGLAHTHMNGQTLLFFAIGLVFLFTSASACLKKVVYWLFGLSVFAHAVGLTGGGYNWIFDALLMISGAVILIMIIVMAVVIFRDLAKPAEASN
jgi:uncharacterized membrane protein